MLASAQPFRPSRRSVDAFAAVLCSSLLVLAATTLGSTNAWASDDSEGPAPSSAESTPPEAATKLYATLDVAAAYNPMALALLGELGVVHVFRLHPIYGVPAHAITAAARATVTPASAQGGAVLRYRPAAFAELEVAYERYAYFGHYGVLLSYDDQDASFDDLRERKGDEERAGGDRLSGRAILQAMLKPLYVRNETRLERFHFGGRGPWFHESEYDTLLRDADLLLQDKLVAGVGLWAGPHDQLLLLGPMYDVTHAFAAGITRHRLGVASYSQLARRGLLGRPHFYLEAAIPVRDPNRAGELQLLGLFGTSW